jgi:hypothetical protein
MVHVLFPRNDQGGSGNGITVTSGVVPPTSTPSKLGDIYIDTAATKVYNATGTTDSSDWTLINGAGTGDMLGANNLSEITVPATARSNLGLAALAILATVGAAQIDNKAVTLAKMDDLNADRIIGRANGAGLGVPTSLTAAQVRTILGIEANAAADQTGSEIKSLYEAEANTNAFTDAEQTKVGYLTITQGVDLDAIETRVNALDAAVVLKGNFNPSGGSFPGGGTAQAGEAWIATTADGVIDGMDITVNDRVIAINDNASTSSAADWHLADYTDEVQSVAGKTGSITLDADDVSETAGKKWAGETGADVTDADNVSTAGASMISSGAGAPSSTPSKVGNIYIDETNDKIYLATDTTSSADWTLVDGTGAQDADFGGNDITDANIKDYSVESASPTISAGTLTLDFSTGPDFNVSWNANITTMNITNWPVSGVFGKVTLRLTMDGTARTVVWPSGILWAGGAKPAAGSINEELEVVSCGS